MLTISKLDNFTFVVKFGFSRQYFERVNEITGCNYVKEDKCCYFPMQSYNEFKRAFKGEFVYKTERTDFPGEVEIDYKDKYKLKYKFKTPKLNLKPYAYQEYGIQYMLNKLTTKKYVFNCDDVGLGKTIQAIACMMCIIENKQAKKVLILCKKSLRYQWKNEISKFTNYNTDNILVINGTPKQKEKIYDEFLSLDEGILISNYDVVVSDMDNKKLNLIKPGLLIIDEAHTLRGHKTDKNKKISKISNNIKYKILLTGTPMASKPDDLYGVMKLVDKKFFGTKKDFDAKFLNYERGQFGNQVVGYRNLDLLENITHSIMIRRTEKEVELDLPEILPPNRITFTMDNVQQQIYDDLKNKQSQLSATSKACKDKIEQIKNEGIRGPEVDARVKKLNDTIKITSDITKGLQAFYQITADDPRVFLYAPEKIREQYEGYIPKSYKMSKKTECLIDIVDNILESNQKVIIFSMYERCVMMLKDTIEKALNVNVLIYTGSVNSLDRENNVGLFTKSDEHNVIIMTSAGQEGRRKLCLYSLNCGKLLRA